MSYLKKVSVSVSKNVCLKKNCLEKRLRLGFEKFALNKVPVSVSKKVSISVTKTFGLEKKSRYQS